MSNKVGTEKAIADIKTTWIRVVMTIIMVAIMFVPFLIYGVITTVFDVIYDSLVCVVGSFYETKN